MIKDENIQTKLMKHSISLINIKLLNEIFLTHSGPFYPVAFLRHKSDSSPTALITRDSNLGQSVPALVTLPLLSEYS